jgi:hypothetical protein
MSNQPNLLTAEGLGRRPSEELRRDHDVPGWILEDVERLERMVESVQSVRHYIVESIARAYEASDAIIRDDSLRRNLSQMPPEFREAYEEVLADGFLRSMARDDVRMQIREMVVAFASADGSETEESETEESETEESETTLVELQAPTGPFIVARGGDA